MQKALLQIISRKESEMLARQLWWVADRAKAMLMKVVVGESFLLLQLTDLRSLWVSRVQVGQLMQLKAKYAKSLQIKENNDLLLLFENLLSFSDPEALYTFREINHQQMDFNFQKLINIFDFQWSFRLTKVACNPIDLICRQILNPLSFLLQCQFKRCEFIKIKFEQIEKEFLRKMSQMEKVLYKSPLKENESEWKLIMPKYQEYKLNLIRYDDSSKYFYRQAVAGNEKQSRDFQLSPLNKDGKPVKKQLVVAKKFRFLQQQESLMQKGSSQQLQQIINQKMIKKKKKQFKIDFI